ncbi:hypothetical protein [Desulfosarcina ovata]|uniref:Uncharacterized protein n=1 Tax=Desulfosarcina ovata subsp. ovata TaxID=2752305 RepID=A0A5K8AKE0_9BACT|nr:hypothetical protein [Desulfosarcina ovata]BBO93172.1 hypothetical protein DSCOOX_63520 [Desulfosarcina ovata subsp. ovata]
MGLKKIGSLIKKNLNSLIRNLPWLFFIFYMAIWFFFGLLYKHAADESNGDAFLFHDNVLTHMQAERLKDELTNDCPLSLLIPLTDNFKNEKVYQSARKLPKDIFKKNGKSSSKGKERYHTFTIERLGEHWLNYYCHYFAIKDFNYYTLEPYPEYDDFTFSDLLWTRNLIPDSFSKAQRAEYLKAIDIEIRPYKLVFYKGPNLVWCLGCDDPDSEYDTVEERKNNLSQEDFHFAEEYTIFINTNFPYVYSSYGLGAIPFRGISIVQVKQT